jgi:hypothetical protein
MEANMLIMIEMIFEKLGCDRLELADRIEKDVEKRIRLGALGSLTQYQAESDRALRRDLTSYQPGWRA